MLEVNEIGYFWAVWLLFSRTVFVFYVFPKRKKKKKNLFGKKEALIFCVIRITKTPIFQRTFFLCSSCF